MIDDIAVRQGLEIVENESARPNDRRGAEEVLRPARRSPRIRKAFKIGA